LLSTYIVDRGVIATATELLDGRHYPGVVAMCSDALEDEPECVSLLLIRARAHLALRRDLAAQADLREIVRLEPRCAEAFRLLGELAARRDELASAAIFFREALRLDPDDREAADWLLIADGLLRPAAPGSAPVPTAAGGRGPARRATSHGDRPGTAPPALGERRRPATEPAGVARVARGTTTPPHPVGSATGAPTARRATSHGDRPGTAPPALGERRRPATEPAGVARVARGTTTPPHPVGSATGAPTARRAPRDPGPGGFQLTHDPPDPALPAPGLPTPTLPTLPVLDVHPSLSSGPTGPLAAGRDPAVSREPSYDDRPTKPYARALARGSSPGPESIASRSPTAARAPTSPPAGPAPSAPLSLDGSLEEALELDALVSGLPTEKPTLRDPSPEEIIPLDTPKQSGRAPTAPPAKATGRGSRAPIPELPGFGEYLVETGVLTLDRLRAAQAYQRSMRVQLSTAIVTLGLATPQRIEWASVAHQSELARRL
jgi:hypothetical protein